MRYIASFFIFISLILPVIGSFPTTAHAQEVPRNFDCTRSTQEQEERAAAVDDKTRTHVRNFIVNAFSRNTLSYRLRCDPLIVGRDTDTDGVPDNLSVYRLMQNLVNFGVLMILLVIAFANILRYKLDTYAVKKSIPLLIFGVIMANLGLPILRTIVELANTLTASFITLSSVEGTKAGFTEELIKTVYQGGAETLGSTIRGAWDDINIWIAAIGIVGLSVALVGATVPLLVAFFVGGVFLMLLPAIMFFILGLLFIARLYVIVLLAAVSPLAFATLGFEPLKGKVWGWWWGQFIKWTFMAPATFFLFWLAIQFYQSVGGQQMDIGTYIVTLVLLYYAIQMPLKMGGSIMGKWNEALAKPLQNLAMKPFTATRDYVKGAVPRDTSRFMSSKTVANLLPSQRLRDWSMREGWGTLPLNLSKAIREGSVTGAKKFEERNAKKERLSPAVVTGQTVGEMVGSIGVRKALFDATAREQYQQGQITTEAGRKRIAERAKDAFEGVGTDEQYGKLNDVQKKNFDENVQKMGSSNDREAVQAAVLAHGLAGKELKFDPDGRHQNDPNYSSYYAKRLKDMGVADTTVLFDMYKKAFESRTGQLTLTGNEIKAEEIKSPQDATAAIEKLSDTLLKRFEPIIMSRDEARKSKLLESIAENLDGVKKEIQNLEEIEKDPKRLAEIKTLLLASRTNAYARKMVGELGIAKHAEALGVPMVQQVMTFDPEDRLNDKQNLQIIIDRDGLSVDDVHAILDDQKRQDVMASYTDPLIREQIKQSLKERIDYILESPDLNLDAQKRQEIIRNVIEPKLKLNTDAVPEPIEATDFTKANLNLTPAQEHTLSRRLRFYRATAHSLKSVKEAADEAEAVRKATEAAINAEAPDPV